MLHVIAAAAAEMLQVSLEMLAMILCRAMIKRYQLI
jgi:hypothetical protein